METTQLRFDTIVGDMDDAIAEKLVESIKNTSPEELADEDLSIGSDSWIKCERNKDGSYDCSIYAHGALSRLVKKIGTFPAVKFDSGLSDIAIVGGDDEAGLITIYPRVGNVVRYETGDGWIRMSCASG
jgi:hypothetical protein